MLSEAKHFWSISHRLIGSERLIWDSSLRSE